MKLSVVIVSYNEKNYLEQAITSCLNQQFPYEYEIIIGDDGSSDGSIELIKQYVEKYPEIIKYYVMDRGDVTDIIPSIRVSNVLRRAFGISKGEYIVCMAGDDYFSNSNKFKVQVDFLDNNRAYESCYTDYRKVWDCGDKIDILTKNVISRSVFWSNHYIHVSCYLFRRSVFSNLPDRFFDDTGLIFAMLKTGKSYHIPQIMFDYRQRDNSIMHEADRMELNILELMLFQDIKNAGGFKYSSLSRFFKPLVRCYKNRTQLKNSKYNKYFNLTALYENNMVGELREFDQVSVSKKMRIYHIIVMAVFSYIWFAFLRKLNVLVNCFKK